MITKESVKQIVQGLQKVYEDDPLAESFDYDLKSFGVKKLPIESVAFSNLQWETEGKLEYFIDEGIVYYRKEVA